MTGGRRPLSLDARKDLAARLRPGVAVRIFSPSCDAVGRPLQSKRHERVLEQALCRIAGGVTSTPAHGRWINAQGEHIRERVSVLESYITRPLSIREKRDLLSAFEEVLLVARQEALAISVGSRLFLLRRADGGGSR
jgi:hypothetical protein